MELAGSGVTTREVRAGSRRRTSLSRHSHVAGGRGTGRCLAGTGQTGFGNAVAPTAKILLGRGHCSGLEMFPRLRVAVTSRGWLSPAVPSQQSSSAPTSPPPLGTTSQPNPSRFPPCWLVPLWVREVQGSDSSARAPVTRKEAKIRRLRLI